jgi:hypothetical protein
LSALVTHGACVISLPGSQVEMTDWDQEWQDKISKVPLEGFKKSP